MRKVRSSKGGEVADAPSPNPSPIFLYETKPSVCVNVPFIGHGTYKGANFIVIVTQGLADSTLG